MHAASAEGHLDTVQWLFLHDADVNAQDDERRNPLHVLVYEVCLEIPTQSLPRNDGRLLLRCGVDVDAKDRTGRTADEITKARRHKHFLNLLPDFSHFVMPTGPHLSSLDSSRGFYQVL